MEAGVEDEEEPDEDEEEEEDDYSEEENGVIVHGGRLKREAVDKKKEDDKDVRDERRKREAVADEEKPEDKMKVRLSCAMYQCPFKVFERKCLLCLFSLFAPLEGYSEHLCRARPTTAQEE